MPLQTDQSEDLLPAIGPKLTPSIQVALKQLRTWANEEGLEWDKLDHPRARMWRELLQQTREKAQDDCAPNLPMHQIAIKSGVRLDKREWKSFLLWFRKEIKDELAKACAEEKLIPLLPVRRSNPAGGRPESSEAIFYLSFAPKTAERKLKSEEIDRLQNLLSIKETTLADRDDQAEPKKSESPPRTDCGNPAATPPEHPSALPREHPIHTDTSPRDTGRAGSNNHLILNISFGSNSTLQGAFRIGSFFVAASLAVCCAILLAAVSLRPIARTAGESYVVSKSVSNDRSEADGHPATICRNLSIQEPDARNEALKKYLEQSQNPWSAEVDTNVCFESAVL